MPDFLAAGLLTADEAREYFGAFFQGCDQFVPVFDPQYDTMESIRGRSGLLFSTICTVGCRVLGGTDSHLWRQLNFHNKRMLNAVITTPSAASLEAVQALLVRACYVSERSLLIAVATRMALDMGFPEAYDELSTRFVTKEWQGGPDVLEAGAVLMRKARAWLHLHVLGQILHVDAGDLPNFQFRGDSRRCRILLDNPFSTDLDLFLLPQVELNVLRAKIHDSLAGCSNIDDEDIMEVVRDAKIDVEIWFTDWNRILEQSGSQLPWLGTNLQVQRCWSDTMALCCAVRQSGVENVDEMSPTQRSILLMAKDSLKGHLGIILAEPRLYLNNLRYAMDFVWAKCAFCYLLLLKLALLFPDDNPQPDQDLVQHGNTLVQELSSAGGGTVNGGRSNTGRLYLQLLQTGIDKYSEALRGATVNDSAASQHKAAVDERRHNELESYVPEQFVFEWDFPGLTLFSSPAGNAGWLDDLLSGALNGGEDFYGFGWASAETADWIGNDRP